MSKAKRLCPVILSLSLSSFSPFFSRPHSFFHSLLLTLIHSNSFLHPRAHSYSYSLLLSLSLSLSRSRSRALARHAGKHRHPTAQRGRHESGQPNIHERLALRFRFSGSGSRVWGLGFRVEGFSGGSKCPLCPPWVYKPEHL